MQELVEILYRCNPEADAVGQITWEPGQTSTVMGSWQQWLGTCFQPVLLPHMALVSQQAQAHGARELCRTALSLDAQLSPVCRHRSLEAGKILRFQKPPRGDRVQARFLAEVQSGRIPGHFVTLLALRGAGFSVPLRMGLLAYLLQELLAGGCAPDLVPPLLGASLPVVNAALAESQAYLAGGMSVYG